MRHFGIITVGRSDFSIYENLLNTYEKDKLKLSILASTAHFQRKFGNTIEEIRKYKDLDIHSVDTGIEVQSSTDVVVSISEHIKVFYSVIEKLNLDGVIIIGDRYEAFAAAISSAIQLVPIFHLHGGVITEGSLDDSFRHSISKLASYHFVDNIFAKKRLRQMGEPLERIFHVGAMSIENIKKNKDIDDKEFFKKIFSSSKKKNFVIATFHPSSKTKKKDISALRNMFSALSGYSGNILLTYPNADADNNVIIDFVRECAKKDDHIFLSKNLGSTLYYAALRRAELMIGNSSSGIIETMSFKLPVVNIGNRQKGRDCNENVMHVSEDTVSIKEGIKKSLDKNYKISLQGKKDIYFKEGTTKLILKKLEEVEIGESIIIKGFQDLE